MPDNEPTLTDLYYRLGSIETKLDTITLNAKQSSEEAVAQEKRITSLELYRSRLRGGLVVVVGVASLAATTVVSWASKFLPT